MLVASGVLNVLLTDVLAVLSSQVKSRQHDGEMCEMHLGGLACTTSCLSGLPWLAALSLT